MKFYLFIILFLQITPIFSTETPQLVVKGEAQLFKPADQMELTIGVVTQNIDAQKALLTNNEKMKRVISNLIKVGLPQEDTQTGQFYINPIYKPVPKEIPSNWEQEISHYEVMNTIQVKTQHLDIADKIISEATKAGSNKIENIQFNLKDSRIYRTEAIEKAVQNAMVDAAVVAGASHVKIMGVQSVSLDHTQAPYPMRSKMAMYSVSGHESGTPIEAGLVEVNAKVDIVFNIGN